MRVLAMFHLYTPFHNAGAELMAHAMLRALVQAGHEVDVVLSRDHPEITDPYEHDGVRVHPHVDAKDPMRHLAEGKDLIVSHLECADRAIFLGRRFGVRVIFLSHNTFGQTLETIERKPDMVVYNTWWMADELRAQWRRRWRTRQMPQSTIVHPPVSVDDYKVKPGNKVTLINLFEPKGPSTFYALAERFPDKPFLGVRGAYGEQDVRDLPNVEILDHVHGPDMPKRVYAHTKVLLVPSSYESYGRVAIEAAASGIPVIAHPTPGLREALGEAGIFVDRDDIDGWERELKRLFTPRGWSNSSKAVAARAAELDPTEELAQWVETAEKVAASGRAIRPVR